MEQIIEKNFGILTSAIIAKKMVSFTYEGSDQSKKIVNVEPYLIGRNEKTKNILLNAYFIPTSDQTLANEKPDWKYYLLNKMSNIIISDNEFKDIRPKYNSKPTSMDKVLYCIKV